MAKSDYLKDAIINAVLRNTAYTSPVTVYVALYTTDPTDADTGTEVAEASYNRIAATFGAPTPAGVTANSVAVTFDQAATSWGTVTHFGVRDALTLGNLLYHSNLDVSKLIDVGDTAEFAIGELDITES